MQTNPIYSGDFMWLGRMYEGQHQPLIGRDLFERVQRVFVAANHPPHGTKRQHSFVGLVKRVRIPAELAEAVAKVLRESQSDKERFVRATTMRLQQQQLTVRAKLDRAYDDRLSGRVSDDLWTSKSAELEQELRRVRAEMASHDRASHDYEQTGLQILELAQTAYSLYVTQTAAEQARLLKTLLSNCTFDRGSLCPTYRKANAGVWTRGFPCR